MPRSEGHLHYFVKKALIAFLTEDSVFYTFVGRRRSGKSIAALYLAKLIDPDFQVDQIVFRAEDLMEKAKTLRGTAIVWDEAGVSGYSRDAMTRMNKSLVKLFQVFGYRKLAVIATLQHINMLDKHVRMMTDAVFKAYSRVEEDTSKTKISSLRRRKRPLQKAYYLQPYAVVTDWLQEPMLVPYRIKQNGEWFEIGEIKMPPLEKMAKAGLTRKFLHEYQKYKDEFFESQDMQEPDEKAEWLEARNRAIRMLRGRYGLKQKEIAEIFGISQAHVSRILSE